MHTSTIGATLCVELCTVCVCSVTPGSEHKHTCVKGPGCQANSPGTAVHTYAPSRLLASIWSSRCMWTCVIEGGVEKGSKHHQCTKAEIITSH